MTHSVAENVESELLREQVTLDREAIEAWCTEEDTDDLTTYESLLNEEDESFFSFLDEPQEAISSGVEALARTLDEFFSEETVYYDSSGTFLKFTADIIRRNDGKLSYTGDLQLRLRMPRAGEKASIIVQTDADELDDEDTTVEAQDTPAKAVEEKDLFVGLQTDLGEKAGWRIRPSVGIRLGSKLNPYTKLRLKRHYQLDKWDIKWNETLYSFKNTGSGVDSQLEFNRKIKKDLFRAVTEARWTKETDYFELSQVFAMYHVFSERRALSYYAGAYGKSFPTVHATHYLLGLSYRQKIHKNYLFYELIPQYKFDKINDFDPEFSLTLRLEIIFKK